MYSIRGEKTVEEEEEKEEVCEDRGKHRRFFVRWPIYSGNI
jgi:hypothetical protein